MALKTRPTITPLHRALVFSIIVLAATALLKPDRVWAHPDLIEQIDRLSTEIKSAPANSTLYLQRAEVYRQHAEFTAALADVDSAHKAKADSSLLHLARCRIYTENNKPIEAVKEADALLATLPNHPEALALRARARVALRQTNEALADYSLAISNYPHPEPDLVLERMRLQLAAGKTGDAVAGLDQVLKRIGPALQLQTAAIECQRIAQNYDNALHRLEEILCRMPVKEPWILQRAEILEDAGRKSEALAAYNEVIAGLKRYAPNRQAMLFNRELAERAQAGLKRASVTTSGTSTPSLFLSNK